MTAPKSSFESLTQINNKLYKWIVWWGYYSIVKVNDEHEKKLIEVIDRRIYFTDGTVSELYNSNDTALIVATTLFNTQF